MAVQLVNIGRIANDGTGDDLREAFIKINQSLEDLDLRIDGVFKWLHKKIALQNI